MKYVRLSWIERKSRNGGDVFSEHSIVGQLLEAPEEGNFLRLKDRTGAIEELGKIIRTHTYFDEITVLTKSRVYNLEFLFEDTGDPNVIPIWRHDPKKIDNIKNIEKIVDSIKEINTIMGRPRPCLVED